MESDQQHESQDITEGRWLAEEHKRFLQGIMQHGKDWKIVEKVVKTRTGSQVRSHAQKFFIKLNKINKERKKGKNPNLIQPSQIQREILNLFTEQNITQNTPTEISSLIRKDWDSVATTFRQKKRSQKTKKQVSAHKNKSEDGDEQDRNEKEQTYQNGKVLQVQEQQQSYFMKIIKRNKIYFADGHDFKQLIDFGQYTSHLSQQSQMLNMIQRDRKRSFCLLDQEQNQTKLKQTLINLHRDLGLKQ